MGTSCSTQKCLCEDMDINAINALGNHLDTQMIKGFHLPTVWKVVLLAIAIQLVAYAVYRWWHARRARHRARRDLAARQPQPTYWGSQVRRSLRRWSGRRTIRPALQTLSPSDLSQDAEQPPPAQNIRVDVGPERQPPTEEQPPHYGRRDTHL